MNPVGRLPATNHLDLVMALPLRNRDRLARLLADIYDPASPNYRHFLTPDQFAAQFGPTEADYQAVIAFAKTHGLRVTDTHSNRALVDVNGPVADIEKTFHLRLRLYAHPAEDRVFYAPDSEPSLDLATPLLAVGGLDNFVAPRPAGLRTNFFKGRPEATPWATGSGPGGNFIGRDFRAAYAPGVVLDGAGQSVGLFELDGYYPNDIRAYEELAGLPIVPLTNVLVDGGPGLPGVNNIEVALDIDMAVAMAPGLSRVIVYEGSLADDVLNRMATDNLARQLSCSWSFGPQTDPAREQIFQQFAAQGQSFLQAAGDLGAASGAPPPPSDDPFVTAVGGTILVTTGPGGAWSSETAWPEGSGGISASYSIPVWQQDVSMAANQGSPKMRNVPDVACLADSVVWVVVNNGEQGVVGGTSAATPLWAGFIALANQQAAAGGSPPLGFLNPALYAIGQGPDYAAAFHDITTGNNTNSSSPNKFFAAPGYDLCTGWGAPTGSNLIAALLAPPDALGVAPVTTRVFTGPVGGPFSPAAQNYSLTNTSGVSLNWMLINPAPWLNVTPAGGALAPGGPAATVTAALTSAAANLPAGRYTATVLFSNLNDGFVQSRQVALEVDAAPVITSQPASQAAREGMTVQFTVGTAANGALSFQWQEDNGIYLTNLTDGGNLSGSATCSLTVSNVSPANVGAYSVIVSNLAGMTVSSNALLTLLPWRPLITAQPGGQTALPGQHVTLTVSAVGNQPLSYQWRKNGNNLTDGGRISGAATSALNLDNLSGGDAGTYSVIVSNSLASESSSGAVLSVASVTAPGVTLTRLYSFSGGNDGGNPNGLLLASNGIFYGTTQHGGSNSWGSVFQMNSNGALSGLYSFTGGSDGAVPFAALSPGPDANFYGATVQGGAYDEGTIFRLAPGGALTSLVEFNFTNGGLPYAGLTLGSDSNFYGTTDQGGAGSLGTVFKMTADGALTLLRSFSDDTNGGQLAAGLVTGGNGVFYGTTWAGGAQGGGTVFSITSNGVFKTLVSFNGTNGAFPGAAMTLGADGNFYGVTSAGGASNLGAAFKMTPAGSLSNLHSFTGGSDGSQPLAGLLQGSDGNFYGATASGGAYGDGAVFVMAPDGTLATLAQFDGFNGANPQAALTQDAGGIFYGATQNGGAWGGGAVFALGISGAPEIMTQPAGQAAWQGANVVLTVYAFSGAPLSWQWLKNGTNLADGGNVSGATARSLNLGGVSAADAATYSVIVSNAAGTVSSAGAVVTVTASPPLITQQPASQSPAPETTATLAASVQGSLPMFYNWRKNGTNLADGKHISGSASNVLTLSQVTQADSGTYALWVSNSLGAAASSNAVLSVVPVSAAGTSLAVLHWFSGAADGGVPNALAQGNDGSLYGTTQKGGGSRAGTAFKLTTHGAFTTLLSFAESNGATPVGALVEDAGGLFYGATEYGGTNGAGTVFTLAAGGDVNSIYSFPSPDQAGFPCGGLAPGPGGSFYGVGEGTDSGGPGGIFRITPDGTVNTIYSFTNGADGDVPTGALACGADGNFYGMTRGGLNGWGNVLKITPDGVFSLLYSFTDRADGAVPVGTLAQGSDGNFYGATMHNVIYGYQFYGTIFKITPGGALTTLYALNYTDGAYPAAGLIQGSDGNFYGTTTAGVGSTNGTVFRISPGGALATLVAFDGLDDGSHPATALLEGADGSFYGTTSAGGPGGQGVIFRLSITSPPKITSQPAALTAVAGAGAAFSVAVAGAPPLLYQWRLDQTNITDGNGVSGSTARILNLANLTAAGAGTYSVIVSNAMGSVTSQGALLTVIPAPAFQTIQQHNGAVTLVWTTVPGHSYQLQYATDLSRPDWTNFGAGITAAAATLASPDVVGTNTQRFYRVLFLQ
jgi:uncharacterized repeat protein (TIGR03803 family)